MQHFLKTGKVCPLVQIVFISRLSCVIFCVTTIVVVLSKLVPMVLYDSLSGKGGLSDQATFGL